MAPTNSTWERAASLLMAESGGMGIVPLNVVSELFL
jgi:hypothetical protein